MTPAAPAIIELMEINPAACSFPQAATAHDRTGGKISRERGGRLLLSVVGKWK